MITDERRAAGRSANRRGLDWQRDAALKLREAGLYPHADSLASRGRPGAGDVDHVGDRIIECTIEPWAELAAKLAQARADARTSGVDQWAVWKRTPRQPWGSVMVEPWESWWRCAARLDRLEAADLLRGGEVEEAEQRGYRIGFRCGQESIGGTA
jgi:hypothetical protein